MIKEKKEKIIKLIRKELNLKGTIDFEKTFEENDIDSLDKFNIISFIEKKNNIKISDKLFSKINKLKDLFKYF
jgi:acyl carrier protein